jgi:solute carrier family 10 (sodium/bile acid cotransporter), member 7
MTKQSGGNEAAALVNAVIGNTMGVFLSPLLIVAYLGAAASGTVSYSNIFLKLGVTVVVPLIAGQLFRYFLPDVVQKLQTALNFSYINSALLLVLIWSVFCDTFLSGVFSTVPPGQTALVSLICLLLFMFFSGLSFMFARGLKFGKEDTIATVMCGATKTVALGIPLIRVIFVGSILW